MWWQVAIKAFQQCNPAEQQTAFNAMLVATNSKGRLLLLQGLWKMFPESKRPEIVRTLTSEMPKEAQAGYVLHLATELTYEERVGVVERLLNGFSAFEMSSFVDFLPYA